MRNSYSIKNHWAWVKHNKISKINPRNDISDFESSDKVTFLPMALVEEETGKYSLAETRELSTVKKGYTAFANDDILFAKITPTMENGKIAIMQSLKNGIGYGSTEFHVSRVHPLIEKKYLFYYFIQPFFRSTAKKFMTGSAGQLRVSTDYFKNIEIPLPPSVEQKAIVLKIEQLFSELDNGIKNLKTAQQKLKIYRQSVLKKAFEGELTKEWRDKQTNISPVDELLEDIKKERNKQYLKTIEDWKEIVKKWEDGGKDGIKPKKPQPYKPMIDNAVNILMDTDLPDEWKYNKLGETYEVYIGSTPSRKMDSYWNGNINWVSSGEVAFKNIRHTKETITQDGLDNTSTNVHPVGTILLAMIGEGKTRGQTAILDIPAAHNQNTAALRVNQKLLESKLLYYYFYYTYQETRRIGSGNNQKALNKNRISNMSMPLMSKQEQIQILQELESRLSVCDNIETTLTDTLKKSEALRQSILKKAFEGKLLTAKELKDVKNNSDYESAEKLLERIKQERDK